MPRRLAVITGGTKGLGRAIAEDLLEEGFDVLLTFFHDPATAEKVSDDLSQKYPSSVVKIIRADAGDLSSIDLIRSAVEDLAQPITALVLNAGETDRTSFESIEIESWKRIFDINVHVPMLTVQGCVSLMADDGVVLLTGSLMATKPHAVSLAYGVSKAAAHALVSNLVKFLKPYGVRINGVAPGFVNSEWQAGKADNLQDRITSKISLERFADPHEISDVYLMLITNQYINGEIVVVDGGYSFE